MKLNMDQLISVRSAVADSLAPQHVRLARMIRSGLCDGSPLMRAACAAAEKVLSGIFE